MRIAIEDRLVLKFHLKYPVLNNLVSLLDNGKTIFHHTTTDVALKNKSIITLISKTQRAGVHPATLVALREETLVDLLQPIYPS